MSEPGFVAEQGKENCGVPKVSQIVNQQSDGRTGHCGTGKIFCL